MMIKSIKTIVLLLTIPTFICCNSHKGSADIFKPVLSVEILDFLLKTNTNYQSLINEKQFFCSVIIRNDSVSDECIILITLTNKIDKEKITGFTFVNDDLVAVYLLDDICSEKLLDKSSLRVDINYTNKYVNRHENLNTIDDVPSCTYKMLEDGTLERISEFSLH